MSGSVEFSENLKENNETNSESNSQVILKIDESSIEKNEKTEKIELPIENTVNKEINQAEPQVFYLIYHK